MNTNSFQFSASTFDNDLAMPFSNGDKLSIHYLVDCEQKLITFNVSCAAVGGWMAIGFNDKAQVTFDLLFYFIVPHMYFFFLKK